MEADISRRYFRTYSFSFIILAGLLQTFLPASAESLKVPPMDSKEEGTMVTYYKEGGLRSKAEWALERFTGDGENLIRFTLKGKGLASPFTREISWESEGIWKAEDAFSPLKSETVMKDRNGKILVIDKKSFDIKRGVLMFERQDLTEDNSETGDLREEFKAPPDTLVPEGLVVALRSLPFEPPKSLKVHLLTNEPKFYEVTFKPRGRERIKTSAGEFDCYKIEAVPHLGLLGVFRVFFPKTYFWFTVAPPHFWVRYQGLENGLGTPEVVMELERFEGKKE